MLPAEHMRVHRRGEALRPLYLEEDTSLAKTLIAVYRDHAGRRRGELAEALSDCEELGYDYRLVRGLASVLDSRAVYGVSAPVPPLVARSEVFKAAGVRPVTTEGDRLEVLRDVGGRMGATAEELDASLYADLEDEQLMTGLTAPEPEELNRYYNYAQTVALLAYSRTLKLATLRRDEYLEVLAGSLGEASVGGDKRTTSITVLMKPTRRIGVRGSKMDELLGRTLKSGKWTLEAIIHYPSTNRRPGRLSLSRDTHGYLLERDPSEEVTVIELEPRKPKQSLGEIIVLEELASIRGVTEGQLLKEIREGGIPYSDLGGILVTPGKLEELREALRRVETLGDARSVLKGLGVRSFMPVLEALGYEVELRRPRDMSRVYRP